MRTLAISLILSAILIFLINTDAEVFPQRVISFDVPSIANSPQSIFSNQTSNITTSGLESGSIVFNSDVNRLAQAASANEIVNRNLAAQRVLEAGATNDQITSNEFQTIKEAQKNTATTNNKIESAEASKAITGELVSLFKPCINTVPEGSQASQTVDYTLFVIKGEASLGQIENYVKGDEEITIDILTDLKLYQDNEYQTDIQLLHTFSPYIAGKIVFGQGANIRDVDMNVKKIDTLCRTVAATDDQIFIDTNQKPLSLPNGALLDPISANCPSDTQYSIFRSAGKSPGLSEARLYDKGDVTLYLLVDNKPGAKDQQNALTTAADNRLVAAKLVFNEFEDNESDFNFYIKNIDTSCNLVNYVGTHIDIASKESIIDPMRFFS